MLDAVSTSRILSIRRIEITTSPLCGVWPPTRPVLPPCGTSAMRCSVASLQIAETSAVEPGRNIKRRVAVKQIALLGDIGRDVGRIGHRIFVADDCSEARDQFGRERLAVAGRCSSLVSYVILFPPHRGAAQPVVDGLAEAMMRHRHHRNGARAPGIERAKIAEKIGGGLSEIAAHGQIHHGWTRRQFPRWRRGPNASNASPASSRSASSRTGVRGA